MLQVVILAAGSIISKLSFLRSRCSSPALIPVNTRPLAAYLIDFYAGQQDCRVHLVVNAEVADTVSAELGTPDGRYELKTLIETSGVVDSLAQAIKGFPADDEVIVNLVTTVPTRFVQPDEVLVADHFTQSTHWSGVVIKQEGPVCALKSAQMPVLSQAFTGIFRCPCSCLSSALTTTTNRNDLLAVIEQLQTLRPLRYTTCDWIDCGHETNYYEAKAKLISSRSFNRIQVSLEDGVLRKSSQDETKLKRETDYIQMLPDSIGVYFPRILARRESAANALGFVKTEYYGYPTVAEYLLFWELSSDNWRRMFSRLKGVLQRLRAFPYSIGQSAYEDFYLLKTTQRIEQFLASIDPALRRILDQIIVINGQECRPFSALKGELQTRLLRLYRDEDICVMHGDYCFGNILYDVPSGIVRLIDPRGSFGDRCVGIYGDQKYDLAKLKHSAEYGYDFIVNGLYTLVRDECSIEYNLGSRECSPLVAELMRGLVIELGYKNEDIDLLTSLLFLSMCPLHPEDSNRQLVMYAHGLTLLNSCLNK
jgi:hypothetical protein